MTENERPKVGLSYDEALRQWSDPHAYAELIDLAGGPDLPVETLAHQTIKDRARCRLYCQKREELEQSFGKLLVDGAVLAGGIARGSTTRNVIEPGLWEILEINLDLQDEADGHGQHFRALQFFRPSAMPSNIRSIPDWLNAPVAEFEHDGLYRRVKLRTQTFTLGAIQGQVVRLLHEATKTADPWRTGKELLRKAGSKQSKMADVFKSKTDWRDLIESRTDGFYRLRL